VAKKDFSAENDGLELARAIAREYAKQAGVDIGKVARSGPIVSIGGAAGRPRRTGASVLHPRLVKKLVSG
jgi:hypothetical protein